MTPTKLFVALLIICGIIAVVYLLIVGSSALLGKIISLVRDHGKLIGVLLFAAGLIMIFSLSNWIGYFGFLFVLFGIGAIAVGFWGW